MSSNILSRANLSSAADIERTRQTPSEVSADKKNEVDNKSSSSIISDSAALPVQELLLKKVQAAEEVAKNQNKDDASAQLEQAITVVSDFMNQPPRNVNFTKDNDSGKTVIKVFDIESKELIKQFPSEELISIAQKIQALHQEVGGKVGILLDRTI